MPAGVVTVTPTAPKAPAGEIAVICVALLMAKAALTDPKLTAVVPLKFVPVIVTEVPPVVAPKVGLISLMVGIGGGV
jgi:hypothetical protein